MLSMMMRRIRSQLLYSAVVLASLVAFSLQATAQPAELTTLRARLSGASLVPPNDSAATGSMQVSLDKESRVLKWALSTRGLSGPPVGASFHGPAMPGENAAVAVPLHVGEGIDSGTVTLTPSQVDEVLAERWYVNVVTKAAPEGEIRGQVIVGK
jgi:hypothetical protein